MGQQQHEKKPMVVIGIPDNKSKRYLVVMAKIIGPHEYKIEEPVHPSLPYKEGDLVTTWGRTNTGLPIVSRKLTDYEIQNHSYLD